MSQPPPFKTRRLKKRAEFLAVASKGAKAPMPGLVMQLMPRADDAPFRPVANDRVADLLRHRETDAKGPIIRTRHELHDQAGHGRFGALSGNRQELRPFLEAPCLEGGRLAHAPVVATSAPCA